MTSLNLALALAELSKAVDIVDIGLHRVKDKLLILHTTQNLLKTFEILARHSYIEVVIPRDKASVTCCTKKGARAKPPGDVMLLTNFGKYLKHTQHLELILP
jgi:hypothetical protein